MSKTYRKGHGSHHQKTVAKQQQQQQQQKDKPEEQQEEQKKEPCDDDTYNSGFSTYLRSSEGLEMMKLFVFANSVIVILTMAWPNMKQMAGWFKELYDYYF